MEKRKVDFDDFVLDLLDVELEDDNTEFGGTSFYGETLRDFMNDVQLPYNSTLERVNNALKECGIKELKRHENN